jgi:hypothetical protein
MAFCCLEVVKVKHKCCVIGRDRLLQRLLFRPIMMICFLMSVQLTLMPMEHSVNSFTGASFEGSRGATEGGRGHTFEGQHICIL